MRRHAAVLVFRIAQAAFPAAEQLDALLHVQNADAVAGELGRLLIVGCQHGVDGGLFAVSKAAARIPDANFHAAVRRFLRRDHHRAPVAPVFDTIS